ncbi:hypothetical protein EST38_g11465 [Candolleomyces aberdarensis]|uniref:Extracellular serine-rich protein n=1 Tax=Candolleomyces aberdarensis TaxID=2316362 RepID=A0A4Q2D4T8_9AGAR|nr:hypothetical protein EST38_g11465 [Candolleomyces aberdarensis]
MKYSGLLLASVLPFAMAYEYRVGVGKDETTGRKGMGFDPSVIHPSAGDTIAFEFRSGVHSAVQSSFDNPCVGNGGFNSGVHTVSDDLAVDAPGLPIVRVTVNDTEPLWFFDEAGGLCHQGAVLAVNPTAAQTATIFKENAALPPKPASSSSSPPSTTSTSTSTANDSATRPDSSASGLAVSGWLATAAGVVLGGLFM